MDEVLEIGVGVDEEGYVFIVLPEALEEFRLSPEFASDFVKALQEAILHSFTPSTMTRQ